MHSLHAFHIPVMGTGHSIDTPIRVAHLGIDSVISVVDDLLLEKIRKHYSNWFGLPFRSIPRTAPDGRADRVRAYLECVGQIVQQKFDDLKQAPLFCGSEKDRYFRLLPDHHPLKQSYQFIAGLRSQTRRRSLIETLTSRMTPGRIEVNIMAKVDALQGIGRDRPVSPEYSDANAALRGVATCSLPVTLVLSAGFNPRLYSYLSAFGDFYRTADGDLPKKIVLKVSDFRSALVQGKFLAKKGIEVSEFRVESGLNCGGHAFPSDGQLLPVLLEEFRSRRDELADTLRPMILDYYKSAGMPIPEEAILAHSPAITVQGGIGTHGEATRLMSDYGMDRTGWGSPFLLVPEATCVDEETMSLLERAGEEEFYLSGVSPLGVPFNNIRGSGSETYTRNRALEGKPGSACPKGYLVSNTEFTEEPICTASSQYQLLKIDQIEQSDDTPETKARKRERVLDKSCLCQHLGSGALIRLGIQKPSYGRQAICPGPNLAWFDRRYSLEEMVDHIYGRGESLVPAGRPHMFAKELVMYVDYLEDLLEQAENQESEQKRLGRFIENLRGGMQTCLEIAGSEPFGDENLNSLEETVIREMERLDMLCSVNA